MKRETAIDLLNAYMKRYNDLPKCDSVVYSETNFATMEVKDYTFVGLLCIVYDLEQKQLKQQ